MHNILSGQGKNPAKRQTNAERSVQLKCLVIPELLLFRCSPTPWSINGGKEKKNKKWFIAFSTAQPLPTLYQLC